MVTCSDDWYCEEKRDHDSNGISLSYDESSIKLYQPHLSWLSLPATRIERHLIHEKLWGPIKIVKVLCFTIWLVTRRVGPGQVDMPWSRCILGTIQAIYPSSNI